MDWTLLILSLPSFSNFILTTNHYNNIYNTVTTSIIDLSQNILARILSKIINNISKLTINHDPEYNHKEIVKMFNQSNNTILESLQWIKSILICGLIFYLRKNTSGFYKYSIDYIYRYYNSEISVFSYLPSETDKRNKLKMIFIDRRWDELFDRKNIMYIFELSERDEDNKIFIFIDKIKNTLSFNFLRFTMIWTLLFIHPLLGIIVDFYLNLKLKSNECIPSYLMSLFLAYLTGSDLYGSIIMVNSDYIIKPIANYINEKQYIRKLFYIHKYCISYLLIWLFYSIILVTNYYFDAIVHYIIIFWIIFFCMFVMKDHAKLWLYVMLPFASNYNILHIVSLSFILHIGTNIYYLISDSNYGKHILNPNLVRNYFKPIKSFEVLYHSTIEDEIIDNNYLLYILYLAYSAFIF